MEDGWVGLLHVEVRMSSMHAKFLEWVARLGQWKATTDALDQVKWPRLNDNFRIIISETKHQ